MSQGQGLTARSISRKRPVLSFTTPTRPAASNSSPHGLRPLPCRSDGRRQVLRRLDDFPEGELPFS